MMRSSGLKQGSPVGMIWGVWLLDPSLWNEQIPNRPIAQLLEKQFLYTVGHSPVYQDSPRSEHKISDLWIIQSI